MANRGIYGNLAYIILLESVEELDNVGGSTNVDKQELRELVVSEVALRQHPPTEDEKQQQQLLQQANQLFLVQL